MHLVNFEDIQVGKSITETSNQLINSLVERIDLGSADVTISNKYDEIVLKYRKDLKNETFEISVIKDDFWYITLDGDNVDSVEVDQFESLIVKQVTPNQMAIDLESQST